MVRELTGTSRNSIFMALLTLAAIILIGAIASAHRQDVVFKQNYTCYQQAARLTADQKYSQAQALLDRMDADFQTSYQVLFIKARCAAGQGDYAAAAQLFQQVQQVRPAMLQEPTYLTEYGLVLYQLGDQNQARLYLQESLRYDLTGLQASQVTKILAEMDAGSKGAR